MDSRVKAWEAPRTSKLVRWLATDSAAVWATGCLDRSQKAICRVLTRRPHLSPILMGLCLSMETGLTALSLRLRIGLAPRAS